MYIKQLFSVLMMLCIVLTAACSPAPPPVIPSTQSVTPTTTSTPVPGCEGVPIDLKEYGGIPFESPAAITSQGGVLNATLEVKYGVNHIAGCRVNLRSYNGELVGPTLSIKPGDRIQLILKNMLPNPSEAHNDTNDSHNFNVTNLHTHGLHVSPRDISDNVLRMMPPSAEEYIVEIRVPSDHPAGTFWYHPHVHGSTAIQVSSGMAGALIVEGGLDEVPEIKAATEQILVLQQIAYDTQGTIENFETSLGFVNGSAQWANLHRQHTINGQLYPTLTMSPGEVQRWRLIHAGVEESIMATIYGPSTEILTDLDAIRELPVNKLHEIAEDGLALGKIDDWPQLELQPGYRSDVLAKFEEEGNYYLIDESTDDVISLHGIDEPAKFLARIQVDGERREMPLPEASELASYRPFKDIGDDEITGYQSVVFCMCATDTPGKFDFTVNGASFDPTQPRTLKLKAVEEWEVSTDINSLAPSHPFHIHVNPFQFVRLGPDGRREVVWKDTLIIRKGTPQKLRMRYEDFFGKFVMHCHILGHEDQGMMQLIEIVP